MKTKRFFNHFLTVLILVLLLSGCASTPLDWFSFSETGTGINQTLISAEKETAEQERVSIKNDSVNESAKKLIQLAETSATNKKLDSLVAELDLVKSDVNRIIELEAELGFIVNQLAKQGGLNSLTQANLALSEYTPQSMPDTYAGAGPKGDDELDFVAAAEKLNQTAVVGQAKPLMIMSDKPEELDIQSKFSSTANQLAPASPVLASINNLNDVINTAEIDDKFSRNDVSALSNSTKVNKASIVGALPLSISSKPEISTDASIIDKCEGQTPSSNIGVHLISLKDQKKVSKAANDLLDRFSEQLCSSYKVNSVVVKGESYFSVRFGPYATKEDAQKACSSIRAQGQYCGLSAYEGQLM